jgi:hypothetical protein
MASRWYLAVGAVREASVRHTQHDIEGDPRTHSVCLRDGRPVGEKVTKFHYAGPLPRECVECPMPNSQLPIPKSPHPRAHNKAGLGAGGSLRISASSVRYCALVPNCSQPFSPSQGVRRGAHILPTFTRCGLFLTFSVSGRMSCPALGEGNQQPSATRIARVPGTQHR